MNIRLTLAISLLALPSGILAQGVDQKMLLHPPPDSWPTYHGDYSGRRYSTLDQINKSNVKTLGLAWVYTASAATDGANIGGEYKDGDPNYLGGGGGLSFKDSPLLVNGVLYITAPDHAWALDARTGRELWHYFWRTMGGHHDGERGFGMYGNWLFMQTADDYIVSLDAATGKERWHKQIADVKRGYWSTMAPIVVGNHVLVGVSGDNLDVQGLSGIRGSGNRRSPVEMVHDAAEARRRGLRFMAGRLFEDSRRRHDMAASHLRSGVESGLCAHGQSESGGRQPKPQRR